jgi:hypothetical protein
MVTSDADRSPALQAFLAVLGEGRDFGQVRVAPSGCGWELRHVADGLAPESTLRQIAVEELRKLAQNTGAGAFRPLKGAPTLVSGWRVVASDAAALERSLEQLYPGSLADWAWVRAGNRLETTWESQVGRQTGIFRGLKKLAPEVVGDVVRAGCAAEFCGKRRRWTTSVLGEDPEGSKTDLPCLEPCAVLMELGRRAGRLGEEPPSPITLGAGEWAIVAAALDRALAAGPGVAVREGDVADPGNPRCFQLLREKLHRQFGTMSAGEGEKA